MPKRQRTRIYAHRTKKIPRRQECNICRRLYRHKLRWCYSRLESAGAIQGVTEYVGFLRYVSFGNHHLDVDIYQRLDGCGVNYLATTVNGERVKLKAPQCFFPRKHNFINKRLEVIPTRPWHTPVAH